MIGYDRLGSGEPLVLIHGLGADRHVWRPVLEAVADRRDVIALDMPGFGESPALNHGDSPSPPAMAKWIASELAALGIERPHVAGNSLGGWVSLELALLGAARSVTAIAPAGLWKRPLGPKPNFARPVGKLLWPLLPGLLRTGFGRSLALAGSVAYPRRIPGADATQLVRAYLNAPDFKAVNAAMRSSKFEQLDAIDVPLTFGWPTRDRLISKPRKLPRGSHSVTLERCGHIPMWDDPGAVADLLLSGSRTD